MWNNAINAWWPLLFYAATDAPRFRKGMIAMICTCVATLGVTALVWWLERREHRRGRGRVKHERRETRREQSPSVAVADEEEREEKTSSDEKERAS